MMSHSFLDDTLEDDTVKEDKSSRAKGKGL